jgi:hypothetical protein
MKALTLAVAGTVALALPASAHDLDEIEAFERSWRAQLVAAAAITGGLSIDDLRELVELRRDFEGRHAWHYNPAPAPARRSSTTSRPSVPGSVEAWRPLVAQHFPAGEVDRALCLIYHESRGDPSARNPRSSATGLFQILAFWEDRYGLDRLDPAQNVQLARIIRDAQGWTAWNPYKRGLCR